MLGWELYVIKQADVDQHDREAEASRHSLASWREDLGGTDWLDDLVTRGIASDRGGTGYPIGTRSQPGRCLLPFRMASQSTRDQSSSAKIM
jgi:hypothetical protein